MIFFSFSFIILQSTHITNIVKFFIFEPTLGFEPRMSFLPALQEQCNTIMRSRLIKLNRIGFEPISPTCG